MFFGIRVSGIIISHKTIVQESFKIDSMRVQKLIYFPEHKPQNFSENGENSTFR